ncbi:MAG: hypothetical protein ACOY5Y_06985 [Pseudomonadota bacterium]
MFDFVRPAAIDTTTLASSNVAETVALWDVGTTYDADDEVYRVVGGIHRRYISQQGSNLGVTPETDDDASHWLDAGPTNAWAMFDETNSTVTENADSIEVSVDLPATERADTLYLSGLAGLSVTVQVTDPVDGLVYDETFGLRDVSGIADEYDWSFEPILEKTELLVTDLSRGEGSTVDVTIDNTGGTAACGVMVLGFRKALGKSQWAWRIEIRDYSRFVENDFGDRVLLERGYRKLASGNFLVENALLDSVAALLSGARAAVRLYIVDDGYTALAIFGTCRWAIEMSLPPSLSLCSAQLESNV